MAVAQPERTESAMQPSVSMRLPRLSRRSVSPVAKVESWLRRGYFEDSMIIVLSLKYPCFIVCTDVVVSKSTVCGKIILYLASVSGVTLQWNFNTGILV